MTSLHTARLDLLALTPHQLKLCRDLPAQLETELAMPISRAMVTDRVRHAITMKLERMASVDESRLLWLTYWLIVIRQVPVGAGLVGFKGFPDENGEVEIGYGIDPAYQRRGYMTEAVRRMIQWAFADPACRSVVARQVGRGNVGSQHVLANVGMTLYEQAGEYLSYRIRRE